MATCPWDGVCLWCMFVLDVSRARVQKRAPKGREGEGNGPRSAEEIKQRKSAGRTGERGGMQRGVMANDRIWPAIDAGSADG